MHLSNTFGGGGKPAFGITFKICGKAIFAEESFI